MRRAAMNKFYRIVWNAASQCWQAVCETARDKSKSSCSKSAGKNSNNTAAILISTLLLIPTANAEPTGGSVTAGQGNIQQSGTNTTITQQSPKLAIDWNTFSINAQDSVNFIQPNTSSIALNRVTGAESSSILGSLTANGQVWILNPNGVLFGNSAQVNVGGLVATTLNLSNEDYMLGKYSFNGSKGTVENRGVIKVPEGGIVALLAPIVKNNGSILATQGNVLLAAAEAVTLQPEGSSLSYTINRGALNALAENGGLIQADGGRVVLTTAARDSLTKSVTNNTGIIEANTIQNQNGTILLLGDMQHGTVNVAGTLSAAALNSGDGGFIETSAATVKVADGTIISTHASHGKTGHWLIDPADYTIASTGGDITGTQLGTNLGTNNVTIQSTTGSTSSNGDVNVNDTVSWSANKLTLNAQRNININSAMYGSGTAQLALEYGQALASGYNTSDYFVNAPVNLSAGNNFSTKIGFNGTTLQYTVINELGNPGSTTGTDLQGIQGDLGANYVLGSNIDASATAGGSWGTTGFNPIGNEIGKHTGIFDGLGHNITNLTINRPSQNYVGLFGYKSSGQVRNIELIGGNVIGNGFGSGYTGMLVGWNFGTVINSSASGSVSGRSFTGGLVGYNQNGTVTNSSASASVNGMYFTGGLVGYNGGRLSNSYAIGGVSGRDYTGGLVGGNGGTLSSSYATGSVSGPESTGGLVGRNYGTLSNSYSIGSVSGTTNVGGLVGYNIGTVNASYWNLNTSGQAASAGGTGLSDAQMHTASNFTGFNFTTVPSASGNNWVMVDTDGTLNNAGGVAGGAYPMLASEYSITINNAHQLQLMAMNLSGNYTLNHNIDAANTGTAGDVWSGSGFIPIGRDSDGFPRTYNFRGSFDGLGHTINSLTVNRPNNSFVGLFGATGAGSTIKNIGIIGGNFIGNNYVGGLTGANLFGGSISNSYSSSNVTGNIYVGGLSGYDYNGQINNSYTNGTVAGAGNDAGGLVGLNEGNAAIITNSYSTSNVTGNANVGGLLGRQIGGSVTNSYSTGVVKGNNNSGGLIGNNSGNISSSFSNSQVTGTGNSIGGLVGLSNGTIINAYATGGVSGNFYTGGLVGWNFSGNISNVYATGSVRGSDYSGGLVGLNYGTLSDGNATGSVSGGNYSSGGLVGYNSGALSNAYSTGNVSGSFSTGGLVGVNFGTLTNAFYDVDQVLINSGYQLTDGGLYHNQFQDWLTHGKTLNIANYFTLSNGGGGYYNVSDVQGLKDMLGFTQDANVKFRLGSNLNLSSTQDFYLPTFSGTFDGDHHVISNLYVHRPSTEQIGLFGRLTGVIANLGAENVNVNGINYVGGLVGYNKGSINNSYVTGTVRGGSYSSGGLVGINNGSISNVYTTSSVNGTNNTGGLVGTNNGILTNAYTLGSVSGISNTGGLVGYNSGNVNTSFWDTQTSGQSTSAGGAGLTTSQMQQQSNFTGFDFTNSWIIYNGHTAPLLRSFMTPLTVTANSASMTYNGQAYNGINGVTYSSTPNSNLLGTVSFIGSSLSATNAGIYAITPSGLYSSQQGYSISFIDGTLTIDPRSVSLTGNRIYDGMTSVTSSIFSLDNLISGETLILSGTGNLTSKNVAAGTQEVTLGTLALGSNTGLASNYTFTGGTHTATIASKALTLASLTAANKIYDGNTSATITGNSLTGVINGDLVDTSITSASFDTKNVGTAKTVTASGIGLTGIDAGNYSVDTSATTQADITAKAVTLVTMTADNKIYDGNTTAFISARNISGLIQTDDVGATVANANFDTKNIGTGKTVSVDGIALSGADAGNYLLNTSTATTLADITPKALTISGFASANKVYDRTTLATITNRGTLTGIVAGESVNFTNTTATFSNHNAGLNKIVTLNGVVLDGIDSSNYIYNGFTTDLSDITPKPVRINGFSVYDKKYDGTTLAIIKNVGTLSGIITGDFLGFNYTNATFADAIIGRNKTVTLNGVGFNGADALNYLYISPTTTRATIRP